jgi:photosystem II stability/assembly factor-like uncharacterized protein
MKELYFRLKYIPLLFFSCVLCVVFMGAAQAQGSWTTGGPYTDTYINTLAMAEGNPDIIYAGTVRGVFKTVDGGYTWTKINFPDIEVRAVAVVSDNPGIVYVGTDHGAPPVYPEDGIYKSEDGGSTWTQKGLSGARVNTIAIDPLNPQILYAGTGKPESSYSEEIIGIFKSTDGGETWEEKLSEGFGSVTALLIDADNSSYIYAGVETIASSPYYDKGGLRKSTDGGETWVSKQLRPDYWNTDGRVVALAMTPAGFNPPAIYGVTWGDDAYKSTDMGESWAATNTPYISLNPPWSLAVDPNNPDVIYAGTRYGEGQLYKSTDGANTWSIKVNGLPSDLSSSPSSIVIDPRNSDVYVGLYDSGVYRSTDGAESWSIVSKIIDDTYIKNLAVHPTFSNTVLAAVYGDKLAKTTDEGTSWNYLVDSPTTVGGIAFDPQNPSTIWVGGGSYVYKSSDDGQNWVGIQFLECYPGPCDSRGSDILIKPDDSDSILVGTSSFDGVLARTTDGGLSWEQLGFSTTALATDPNNPDVVYMGKTQIGQIFQYFNVWESMISIEITPAEGIGGVGDIEVDSDSKVYVAASDGLWRWDGSDWTTLTGLPASDITALAIDRSSSPGIVYVGTGEDGVFVTEDGGSTWTSFNEGLENLSITKLAISDSLPKMLYAGTAYGGIYGIMLYEDAGGDGGNGGDEGGGNGGETGSAASGGGGGGCFIATVAY